MSISIEEKQPKVSMKGMVKRFPTVVANQGIDFRKNNTHEPAVRSL
jgi:hypothetical protein